MRRFYSVLHGALCVTLLSAGDADAQRRWVVTDWKVTSKRKH